MASSSSGRKKRLVSSLDGEVLERLSMKLNPRMLLKDYKTLAGRLKYTYEYIRNFDRERDPTLALLQHWWSTKRGKEKTVTVLIEHLSEMERDDAVDLLRPYEYYTSHEAAEYDESFERPVISGTADINRNHGLSPWDHELHLTPSEFGAYTPDLSRNLGHPRVEFQQSQRTSFSSNVSPGQTVDMPWHAGYAGNVGHPRVGLEIEQSQGASFSRDFSLGHGNPPGFMPLGINPAFQAGIPLPSAPNLNGEQHARDMPQDGVFQSPAYRNQQYLPSVAPRLNRESCGAFSSGQFDEMPEFTDDFPGARRDVRLHRLQRPHTLDGSSASSVDGGYYCGITSEPQGLFNYDRMREMRYANGELSRHNEQFRNNMRHMPSDHGQYGSLAQAGGHTMTAATDKVALVIGNQDYAHKKLQGLQYPEQDAADVASALKNLNFKVVSLVNLTLVEMRTAMLAFCCLLGKGVYGVVYYAGHGYEDNGENFLLPVDSDLKYNREHSLRTQEILEAMQQCDTSLNLLIIDACRVSLPNKCGITVPRIKKSVKGNNIFAYSCCSQQESLEEPNCRNGMYCSHLLRRLSENRRVENILMDVATDFARCYNLVQRPCLETDCKIDFRLTDPVQPEFLTEESTERLRRWNQANRHPQEFSTEDNFLRYHFKFQAVFSNVLHVTITTVKKVKNTVSEFYLRIKPNDPLRCLDQEVIDFPNGDIVSRQSHEVINIQKLYKVQGPLILSLDVMYKVDEKLRHFEKDLDFGWPLVSSVMCLWDHWLLGDRCRTTAV